MAPVRQVVIMRLKDLSKKDEVIANNKAYFAWAHANEAHNEHVHHTSYKISADGEEHTTVFIFKDGGAMDKLIPIVMAYPNMEQIKWTREQFEESSNVYSISDEDKPALVAINEARKRVCTYNNEPVNMADYPAGHEE